MRELAFDFFTNNKDIDQAAHTISAIAVRCLNSRTLSNS